MLMPHGSGSMHQRGEGTLFRAVQIFVDCTQRASITKTDQIQNTFSPGTQRLPRVDTPLRSLNEHAPEIGTRLFRSNPE